jgi:hypothetical protein
MFSSEIHLRVARGQTVLSPWARDNLARKYNGAKTLLRRSPVTSWPCRSLKGEETSIPPTLWLCQLRGLRYVSLWTGQRYIPTGTHCKLFYFWICFFLASASNTLVELLDVLDTIMVLAVFFHLKNHVVFQQNYTNPVLTYETMSQMSQWEREAVVLEPQILPLPEDATLWGWGVATQDTTHTHTHTHTGI